MNDLTQWLAVVALAAIGVLALTHPWWPIAILCVLGIYALARPPQ